MMGSEPKFTKAPLHVVDQGRGQFPLICGERGIIDWVAVINDGPEAMANAHLFAAAPELYAEAARAQPLLRKVWDTFGYPEREDVVSEAREHAEVLAMVLAKARGE